MKIAILGTRGIPNNYGGFEQFAEYLSVGLVQKGHDVYVYNSHDHPFKATKWQNVNIIHCYDPEQAIGTAGQFIYDLNCILDSRKRKFDIIFQLGYTSSSIWNFLFSGKVVVVTNMDGLEWKRSKYSRPVQKFLKYAEGLAVRKSDHLVADSIGIKDYLKTTYNAGSEYIPYGANAFNEPAPNVLVSYGLEPYAYNMLIARLEPENSIEIICDGCSAANTNCNLLVVANHKTKYGEYLKQKYADQKNIRFLGAIYDIHVLNNLRYYSNVYFHGHTVGGTNPSLLEAMASGALIAAHNNPFNAAILNDDAFYFSDKTDVKRIAETVVKNETQKIKLDSNSQKIKTLYSWEKIISDYNTYLSSLKKIT
jgi:glycosyltransferase involved in cell wall biosynthesis